MHCQPRVPVSTATRARSKGCLPAFRPQNSEFSRKIVRCSGALDDIFFSRRFSRDDCAVYKCAGVTTRTRVPHIIKPRHNAQITRTADAFVPDLGIRSFEHESRTVSRGRKAYDERLIDHMRGPERTARATKRK